MQLVAPLLFHVRVDAPPAVTDVGFALKVTVGFDEVVLTVTVLEAETLPPGPVHVRTYVDEALKGPVDLEPLVLCEPDHAPEALQAVAFRLVHDRVELAPLAIDVGLAESETVGAAGGDSVLAPAIDMDEVAGVPS